MNRESAIPGGAGVYPLAGDVLSQAGNSLVTVIGLRSIPILPSNPVDQQVLVYTEATNAWGPGNIPLLETNGTPNGSQILLNLVPGTNITVTDDGTGNVTIAATGGSGYSLGGTMTTANVALGPAAGTGAVLNVVNGLDGNHFIQFTVGTSPLAAGALLTVTYTASRGHLSYPILGFGSSFPSGANIPFITAPTAFGYELAADGVLTTAAGYEIYVSAP